MLASFLRAFAASPPATPQLKLSQAKPTGARVLREDSPHPPSEREPTDPRYHESRRQPGPATRKSLTSKQQQGSPSCRLAKNFLRLRQRLPSGHSKFN